MKRPKDPKAELGNVFQLACVYNGVKMQIDVVLCAYYSGGRVQVHAMGAWANVFRGPIWAKWKDLSKANEKERDLIDARTILEFNTQQHPLGTRAMVVPMDLLQRLIKYASPRS
jgi:hypothetical protein